MKILAKLIFEFLRLIFRSKQDIVLENLALRQQLAVQQHSIKRPKIKNTDRIFWVWLSRIWNDVLCWLQGEPDATAKAIFDRLQREHPGLFHDGQLKTLQRRIREWRQIMARKLVYSCIDGNGENTEIEVVGAVGVLQS